MNVRQLTEKKAGAMSEGAGMTTQALGSILGGGALGAVGGGKLMYDRFSDESDYAKAFATIAGAGAGGMLGAGTGTLATLIANALGTASAKNKIDATPMDKLPELRDSTSKKTLSNFLPGQAAKNKYTSDYLRDALRLTSQ